MAREGRRAFGRGLDQLDVPADDVVGRELPEREVTPGNDGEQVLEVVGDPAGQLANRLQLLRLTQLRLEPLALRDIRDAPLVVEHLAARVPFDSDPQAHPDEGAIAPPPLQLVVLDPREDETTRIKLQLRWREEETAGLRLQIQ